MECPNCYEEIGSDATKCIVCGIALHKANGTSNNQEQITHPASPVLTLTLMPTGEVLRIASDGIIGREGNIEPEFFSGFEYVARLQCEITLDNNEYKVEHLQTATNPTSIGNIVLRPKLKMTIRDGDILTLADKSFRVNIGIEATVDSISEDAALTSIAPQGVTAASGFKYIVTCRECGTEYPVASADDRIQECSNCDDYDKHKISRATAALRYADR